MRPEAGQYRCALVAHDLSCLFSYESDWVRSHAAWPEIALLLDARQAGEVARYNEMTRDDP